MKIHKRVHRDGITYTYTGSLCGRLNNACTDGMNITDKDRKVTCKFCLKLLRKSSNNKSKNKGDSVK